MVERPNYPDSTGSHWVGGSPGRRADAAERPQFLDRTEPLEAGDIPTPPGRGDRAPADRGPDRFATELLPSVPPRPRPDQQGQQWPIDRDGPVAPETGYADPELAAMAEPARQAPVPEAAPRPVSAPAAPRHQGSPLMDEPTQLHNPVAQSPHHVMPQSVPPVSAEPHRYGAEQQQHEPHRYASEQQQKNRRGYPEQVGDGVYRRSRPGLGILVTVIALAMGGLIGYMLVQQITASGPVSPSAVLSACFALAGLPLTVAGIAPLLGTGSNSGPEDLSAVLRAPYVYLVTGLALLIAAGLAAG